MSNVAHLPILADRYTPCVRTIYLKGFDATGLVMRAQVRPAGDTPGTPLVDLLTVTNGNAEGLRLVEVKTVDGLPTSTIELVINETTMEGLPYVGELGDATPLVWDWQVTVAGRKQRIAKGPFTITGDGVTGAEVAPVGRPLGYGNSAPSLAGGMRTGATLTFGDDTVSITIDGANLAIDAGNRAVAAMTAAQLASATATAAGRYFTTRAAGEAASTVNQLFATDDGAGNVIYYKRTSSGSTEIGRALTPSALNATLAVPLAKLAKTVYVTDPPWNAVGDGTTDDSVAIQACVDANKGATIVLPQGKTFLAAGTILSGSSYNGTSVIVQGTYKLKPSGGQPNWSASVSPMFVGILIHDCDGVTVDVPGMMDGNRTAQTAWQQHHCLVLWGATNANIPAVNGRELRGDLVYISSATNVSPLTKNSANIRIGTIKAANSDYDGRNAISIVSVDGCIIESVVSSKIGGVINGETMPGGVDLEADGAWHRNTRIRISKIVVDTAGTSGLAVLGFPLTNDAAEDWNSSDIEIGDFSVFNSGTITNSGGPIFKRVTNLTVNGSSGFGIRRGGASFDFINGLSGAVRVSNTMFGASFGRDGWVRDADFKVRASNFQGPAILSVGLDRSSLDIMVRQPQGGGSYGMQLANVGRTITQTNVTYSVDIPYDANLSGAILVSSVTIGEGTHVEGKLTGYGGAGASLQFLGGVIPTKLVEGRNLRTALPTAGLWLQREQVWFQGPTAGASPGAICVTSGDFSGTPPVFKPMAPLGA